MTHQERVNLIAKVCNGNTMLLDSITTPYIGIDGTECANCEGIIRVCDEHVSGLCVDCYMDNKKVMELYNLK